MVRLSVIVPTKDERTAPDVIGELYKVFGKDTEVIVVDKSNETFRKELEKTDARIIRQESDGYENALMEGFREARGEIIATIDADGTYSVRDLEKVIAALSDGDADFVSGNRFGHLKEGAMSASLKIGNTFLTWLYNVMYRRRLHDALSGVFAMKRKAFESIKEEIPYRAGTIFFEIEIARRGWRLKDIPITYAPRVGSSSKIAKVKPIYGLAMAFHSVRYARDYNPLLIFGGIGIILVIAGLVLGAFVIGNYLATGTLSEVGRALIAFMLMVLGFLSIMTGFILDLLLEISRDMHRKK